ncbi:MAG: glycosyltransferase family 39 protein [Acidobacteria bacterium]|nr:glycosyltransferase family 39 protein [Acidobacteriota bacterium]
MNALLAALSVALAAAVALTMRGGAAAVLVCAACAMVAGALVIKGEGAQRPFLLKIFVAGLLVRMAVGSLINAFELQDFFGGDAITYDLLGGALADAWRAGVPQPADLAEWAIGGGWGMLYMVAVVYAAVGRNMLAVQFVNAVLGAATAPVIFFCARHIFQNLRVAKVAALAVAFYPSLVLWSSQGLKDGPIVFLLSLAMLATLKLGEKLSFKYFATLVLSLFAILTLRFYVFYMLAAAVAGSFVIGMRQVSSQSLARQLLIVVTMGVGLTYMGVLRTAGTQFERYGNLQAVQTSRADLVRAANSGFGADVDVSTASGALSAVWWVSFPLLVVGVWFTLSYRLRQALPILLFTLMLTLAYSIFQGNIGTAYRQRSQILVFYFIFVAVGAVLLKERQEDRQRVIAYERQQSVTAVQRAVEARKRYSAWKQGRGEELERVAQDINERVNF